MVALWPSVSLILDEISGQKTGIIAITAVLLGAFKIVRAAFRKAASRACLAAADEFGAGLLAFSCVDNGPGTPS